MIDTSKVDINKDQVLAELQLHNGRDEGIHIRDLVARITNSLLCGAADERKVRKLIEELRMEGYPICALPDSGYFMAANAKELNETCAFLLARADTTVAQVAAMKNREAPDLYDALGVGRRKDSQTEEENTQ
jgi:hypothetical protein